MLKQAANNKHEIESKHLHACESMYEGATDLCCDWLAVGQGISHFFTANSASRNIGFLVGALHIVELSEARNRAIEDIMTTNLANGHTIRPLAPLQIQNTSSLSALHFKRKP